MMVLPQACLFEREASLADELGKVVAGVCEVWDLSWVVVGEGRDVQDSARGADDKLIEELQRISHQNGCEGARQVGRSGLRAQTKQGELDLLGQSGGADGFEVGSHGVDDFHDHSLPRVGPMRYTPSERGGH